MGDRPSVAILVNGRRLEELAAQVERPHAIDQGSPHLAGKYAGLPARLVAEGGRHFLGHPEEVWFGHGDTATRRHGDTVLLGCTFARDRYEQSLAAAAGV